MTTSIVEISENSRQALQELSLKTGQSASELLDAALTAYLPQVFSESDARETAATPWRFLVHRAHPWRKQLYLKGRNLTARQLVGAIMSNQFNDESASLNFHLPIEAVREALAYVDTHGELLKTEAEIERLMSKREGASNAARSLP